MPRPKKTCSVCPDPHRSLGYCIKHLYYFKKYGDPLATGVRAKPGTRTLCKAPDCSRPTARRGYCQAHRWQSDRERDLTPIGPRGRRVTSPYSRLMAKTTLDGDCVMFTGKKNSGGYGLISHDGKWSTVHRVVWEHHHGAIPDGLCVMHTCDNRLCVNIDHLRVGTWAENNADRAAKGRSANRRGERSSVAKLTEAQAMEILTDSRTHRAIAADHGVDRTTVTAIKRGKNWAHLPR